MKYKAIIADVDGTLIAPNGLQESIVSKRLINAVKKAYKKNIFFSLATARSLDWIGDLVTTLTLSAPLILDNGARLYDPIQKKYIYESFLLKDKVLDVFDTLRQFEIDIFYVANDKRFQYEKLTTTTADNIIKIMVLHLQPDIIHTIYKRVQKISGIQVTKSISKENPVRESIHITAQDATKEHGVELFAKHLNISLNEIIGIGDSYNDHGFMSICGFKVAMGNSVPDIKAIADYIAPSYDKDGVAKVIEKYILGK